MYEESDTVDSNKLGMSNVGGVFVVLIAGCIIAFLVSILEFMWNVRKVAVHEKVMHRCFQILFPLTKTYYYNDRMLIVAELSFVQL